MRAAEAAACNNEPGRLSRSPFLWCRGYFFREDVSGLARSRKSTRCEFYGPEPDDAGRLIRAATGSSEVSESAQAIAFCSNEATALSKTGH